jgi:hypothetical protein
MPVDPAFQVLSTDFNLAAVVARGFNRRETRIKRVGFSP